MRDLFISSQTRTQKLFYHAAQDAFFESILHDLIDYGHDIRFSVFGGHGAYKPFALRTERLDTPERLELFHRSLSMKFGSDEMRARITLNRFADEGAALHSFLHEVMHFYQDMHGLFFIPLEEEGRFPIILDEKSHISAILFNEAWAQVEAIRGSYSLAQKNDENLWQGALSHKNFGALAHVYADELDAGQEEARVAAHIFMSWYEGKHRIFYERHAGVIYQEHLKRYKSYSDFDPESLRSLDLPMLVARLPKGAIPKYFNYFDWRSEVFLPQLKISFSDAENDNVQDIKCGSPAYLWNRLRLAGEDEFTPQSIGV